ncbi:MAG: hypothetical protein ACM3QX_07980 [Syntrophomonadaceae bacterium]
MKTDSLAKYSDNVIKNIYEAKPQMTFPIKLGFYTADKTLQLLEDSLSKINSVKKVYSLPETLVRRDPPTYFTDYYDVVPGPVDLNQLRYLAAQGRTDLLLYCGASYEENVETNGWAWTNILLFPVLFMPSYHINIDAKAEIFLFDVRNNYLYLYKKFSNNFQERYVKYSRTERDEREKIEEELIKELMPQIIQAVEKELNNPENKKTE